MDVAPGFPGAARGAAGAWHSARQAPSGPTRRARSRRRTRAARGTRGRPRGARTRAPGRRPGARGGGTRERGARATRGQARGRRGTASRKRRAEPRARRVTSLHMRTSSSRGTILSRRLLRVTTSCASGRHSARRRRPALAAPRASRCASRRSSARRPRRGRRRSSGARAPRPRAGALSPPSRRARVSPRPSPRPDRPRRVRLRAPRRRRRRRRAVAPARPLERPGVAAAETTGSGEILERATEGRGAAGIGARRVLPPPRPHPTPTLRRLAPRGGARRRRLPRPPARGPDRHRPAPRVPGRRPPRVFRSGGGGETRRRARRRKSIETAEEVDRRVLDPSNPTTSSSEDPDADLSARLADARDGWKAPSPSVAGFASNDSVETAADAFVADPLTRASAAALGIRDLFENATREGEAVAASVASAARSVRVDGDVFVAGAFGALVLIAAASELASAAERSSRNESATTPRESATTLEEDRERPTKAVASEGGVLWSRRRDDEANQGYGFGTNSRRPRTTVSRAPRRRPRRARRRPRCFGLGPRGAAARRGRRRAGRERRPRGTGDSVRRARRGEGKGGALFLRVRVPTGVGSGSVRGLGPVEDENMEDVRMSRDEGGGPRR